MSSATTRLAQFRPDRFTLILATIAVLGAVHILVRTSTYGAAMSNDAPSYLSAALSLAAGEGLRTYSGHEFLMWPPFFPMLMAFASLFGIEPAEAGRLANIAAFGLTILMSGLWLGWRLRSRLLALGAAAAIMTSLPLSHVSSLLMAEPLFILFTLLALMRLESFLNRGAGRPALAASAIFAALAAVTRYMGIALILAGVLVLLARQETPVRVRLKHVAAYGILSSIPLAIALANNWTVSGTLTGYRGRASGQSIFDSLGQVVDVLRIGVFPATAPDWFGYLLLAMAGLVALGAVSVFITARPGGAFFNQGSGRRLLPSAYLRWCILRSSSWLRRWLLGRPSMPDTLHRSMCRSCSWWCFCWTDSCMSKLRGGWLWSSGRWPPSC